MISAIQGRLEWHDSDSLVIKVGGLSLQVLVPSSILQSIPGIGQEIKLFTHLYIREGLMALYGFLTRQEEELFRKLLSVSGIGPKNALAIISALQPGELARAVYTGNAEVLDHIPGIGKKLAGRLLLELKGKLEVAGKEVPLAEEDKSDVASALMALGFSSSEALAAISSLKEAGKMTLEEKVKLALRNIAARP